MKTLITPRQVLELAFADGQLLPSNIVTASDIAAAEFRYLHPVLGKELYAELLEGGYPDLLADYAGPALAACVRADLQPTLDIRTGPYGSTAPKSDVGQPAENMQIEALHHVLRNRSRTLLRRLSDYLDDHAATIPEYVPSANILRRCSTEGGIVLTR